MHADAVIVEREVRARDGAMDNPYGKALQVAAIRGAREYLGDRMMRTAKPHRLLDPDNGPLIAVRLRVLTRKSLGGLETDLDGRVLGRDREPLWGLYATGRRHAWLRCPRGSFPRGLHLLGQGCGTSRCSRRVVRCNLGS